MPYLFKTVRVISNFSILNRPQHMKNTPCSARYQRTEHGVSLFSVRGSILIFAELISNGCHFVSDIIQIQNHFHHRDLLFVNVT